MFEVYRIVDGDQPRRIAECAYLEDARRVLAGWHDGYINQNGTFLEGKAV